jgi:cyanate lyase
MTELKKIIKRMVNKKDGTRIHYKEVADSMGCSEGHVCSDVSRERLSAEKALKYARALGVDAHRLRPDLFDEGKLVFESDRFKEVNNDQ